MLRDSLKFLLSDDVQTWEESAYLKVFLSYFTTWTVLDLFYLEIIVKSGVFRDESPSNQPQDLPRTERYG